MVPQRVNLRGPWVTFDQISFKSAQRVTLIGHYLGSNPAAKRQHLDFDEKIRSWKIQTFIAEPLGLATQGNWLWCYVLVNV
jgi:hypothetical protein